MDAPIRFLDTQRIAPDTYVIRQLAGEGVNPVAFPMNSMVITGDEPVIVDTSVAVTREGWLERVFELVEPEDVRWIYLSHDDSDHTGNLLEVLDLARNATLVTNWFSVERLAGDYMLPLDRMRWVNDGESFHAGDRELVAVVPPTFDSPTTRGLFDTTTGVYWAGDSFAMGVPHEVADVAELDAGFAAESFLFAQRLVSPWTQWLDTTRFGAHLDRVAALGASVVTSGHAVALRGEQVAWGFDLLRQLPGMAPAEQPTQNDLEALIEALALPAAS